MIDGTRITIGGKEYIVPALSFGQIRKLLPKIQVLQSTGSSLTTEQMDAVAEVVQTALSRNYPEMTIETVEEILDLANAPTVIKAILGGSGFVQASSGEEQAGS
jgi:pyruvate carboxylase